MTTPNITTSASLAAIQFETPAYSSSSQSGNDYSEIKQKPLFLLVQTPAEQLLAKLYANGIIDENGRLAISLEGFHLPPQQSGEVSKLNSFLNSNIVIEIGDKDNFYKHIGTALKQHNVIDQNNRLKWLSEDPAAPCEVIIGKNRIAYSTLIQTLKDKGVVDSSGNLIYKLPSDNKVKLPVLQGNRNMFLWKFLSNQTICASIGDTYYCSSTITRLTLFQKIDTMLQAHISTIMYVGGQARYHFKESLAYCEKVFQHLFHFLGHQMTENFIPPDLISQNQLKFVGDEDIRIEEPNAQADVLLKSTDCVTSLLSSLFFGEAAKEGEQWVRDNAFSKLNHIFTGAGDHYSIASLKTTKIEFIFYAALQREELFTDEIRQNITSIVRLNSNQQPSSVIPDTSKGLQALICNLSDIFHVENAFEVNVYGFPMAISRLVRGKLICDRAGLETMMNRFMDFASKQNPSIPEQYNIKGAAGRIAFLMIDGLKKHHHAYIQTGAIAYAFTACNLLQRRLNDEEIAIIWEALDEAFSLKNFKPQNPILASIIHLVFQREIPFDILNALLQVGSFIRLGYCNQNVRDGDLNIFIKESEEKPFIQMLMGTNGDNLSIWSPLSFENALDNLIFYLQNLKTEEDNKQDILQIIDEMLLHSTSKIVSESILKRYCKVRFFDFDLERIFTQAHSLETSDSKPLQHLSRHILMALKSAREEADKSFIIHIIKLFWEMFSGQNHSHMKGVIGKQVKHLLEQSLFSGDITKENSLLHKFFEEHIDKPGNQSLCHWIEALAETGDVRLCKHAYNLWTDHENQFAAEEVLETPLKLFAHFIKYRADLAKSFLESIQSSKYRFPFDREMQAVGSLIAGYKQHALHGIAVNNPLALRKVIDTFLIQKPPETIAIRPETKQLFTKYFVWIFEELRDKRQLDVCISFLTAAKEQGVLDINSSALKELWLSLCKKPLTFPANAADGLNTAFSIWDLAFTLGAWTNDSKSTEEQEFVIYLAENIGSIEGNTDQFKKLIDYISEQPVQPLAVYKGIQEPLANLLKQMINQGSIEQARFKLRDKYNKILHKNYAISLWIYLCHVYARGRSVSEAITIWDKLSSTTLSQEEQKNLNKAAISLLDRFNKTLTDLLSIQMMSKILLKKAPNQINDADKQRYLRICLEASLSIDMQTPHTLLVDLVEALADTINSVGTVKIAQQACGIILSNFLARSLVPNNCIPESIRTKIASTISPCIIELFSLKQYEWICDLLKQLQLQRIHPALSFDAAANSVRVFEIVLSSSSRTLINDLIALSIDVKKWVPSDFSENNWMAFHQIISDILLLYINKGSFKEAAEFFLKHQPLLAGLKSADAWNGILNDLSAELLCIKFDKEAIDLAIRLMTCQKLFDAKLWTISFNAAASHVDKDLLDQVWNSFKAKAQQHSLTVNAQEYAYCWYEALSTISPHYDDEMLLYLNEASNTSSHIHKIFSGSDKTNIRNKTWLLLIDRSLDCDKLDLNMINTIFKLTYHVDGFDSNDANLLQTVMRVDVKIVETLYDHDDPSVFLCVTQHLNRMYKNILAFSLFSWEDSLPQLASKVITIGNRFDNAKVRVPQWFQIIESLCPVFDLMTRLSFQENTDKLIQLCQAYATYRSPLILNRLFPFLLSLIESYSLQHDNTSTSLGIAIDSAIRTFVGVDELDYFDKARMLLVHDDAKMHLGPSRYSMHWGNYIMKMIRTRFNEPSVNTHINAVLWILDHLYLTMDNDQAEQLCAAKAIELTVELINKNDFCAFTNLLDFLVLRIAKIIIDPTCLTPEFQGVEYHHSNPHYFSSRFAISADANNFFHITKTFNEHLWPISLYSYNIEKKMTPELQLISQRFIKYGLLTLNKIMDISFTDENLIAVHIFMTRNLILWQKQFPHMKNEFVNIISRLVYWPPLSEFVTSTANQAICYKLIEDGYQLGFYDDCKENIVEWLFYLKHSAKIPRELLVPMNYEAAIRGAMKCVKSSSIQATTRALEIVEETHWDFFSKLQDPAVKLKCLKTIIQHSQTHFFSALGEDDPVNERLYKLIVLYAKDHEFMYDFFKAAYRSYKDPASQYFGTFYTESAKALEWIMLSIINYNTLHAKVTGLTDSCLEKLFSIIDNIITDAPKEMLKYHQKYKDWGAMIVNAILIPQLKKSTSLREIRDRLLLKFIKDLLVQNTETSSQFVTEVAKHSLAFKKELLKPTVRELKQLLKDKKE